VANITLSSHSQGTSASGCGAEDGSAIIANSDEPVRHMTLTNHPAVMERATGGTDLIETVRVGGYHTARANRTELSTWITRRCLWNRSDRGALLPALVFSSNGQGVALAGHNTAYDAAMAAADVIHADGMSVVLASRILTQTPIRGRSATTDLFDDIASEAQADDLSFFVLGATEDENVRAVAAMQRKYPQLRIVGRRNGYFGRDEDAAVCAEIVASRADVLWVGLGKPLQEIWSFTNREALRGVGCIKTCGGLYAFLNGDSTRAPEWMQRAGLEWIHRLAQDPRRLLRRYLVTNAVSTCRLLMRTG
jgi:N-acetylglucosaminyldiphosphoundecaprenol N-acetyl-beta-D-mannosaminyltransferase